MHDYEGIFKSFSAKKVAVIGDVMLDTYWWGHVDRISPEAPVPVVSLNHKEYRIGGAGNVALNLVSLGAQTTVFTVIGNDPDGECLVQLLQKSNIETGYIVKSAGRITTNKTRVMSRNQQMMRLDSEMTDDIDSADEDEVAQYFERYIINEAPDVVIFEDYNKGTLSPNIINCIIEMCRKHNVITAVDPKRKNFLAYKGATIFKPNLKEVFEGLNIVVEEINKASLTNIHHALVQQLQHEISLITLSEKGIFYQQHDQSEVYPSHVRNIADVSGAGDTVIAVASLVYAATKNIKIAATVANIAGGLVCEEVGTAPINREKLLGECRELLA